MDPLTRIPRFEAPPMPPKKVSGTEITRAHGQETTRKVSARVSQMAKFIRKFPDRSGGRKASAIAEKTTAGVYTRAKRVINF